MAKKEKKEDGPAEAPEVYGKLGHNCPRGCYNGGSSQLFESAAEPGLLECPSCGETFKPAPGSE